MLRAFSFKAKIVDQLSPFYPHTQITLQNETNNASLFVILKSKKTLSLNQTKSQSFKLLPACPIPSS
jgi:hypothetical protein